MKQLLAVCLMSALISVGAIAQSGRYTEAMQKNISALDSARAKEAYQQFANTFERIGNAEKTEWLPFYYAGYALVMQSYAEQDISKLDAILDKADEMISKAASMQQDHSEITNVQAMILQGRMRVDMSRGMTLGPQASGLLQKAMQQQPLGNPRVSMNLAQNLYYTPEAFGGSKAKGLELMLKALAQYDTFTPASPLYPNWGKAYVARMIEQWQASK
jgi:tetratricopeptide (TPR) repeat protein